MFSLPFLERRKYTRKLFFAGAFSDVLLCIFLSIHERKIIIIFSYLKPNKTFFFKFEGKINLQVLSLTLYRLYVQITSHFFNRNEIWL